MCAHLIPIILVDQPLVELFYVTKCNVMLNSDILSAALVHILGNG